MQSETSQPIANQPKPPSVPLRDLLALALVQGLLAGAVFGAWDVWDHSEGLPPIDVLVAIGFAAAIAVPLTLAIALLMRIALFCFRVPLERAEWTATLSSLNAAGLVLATLLFGTSHAKDALGLGLFLLTLMGVRVGQFALRRSAALRVRGVASSATLATLAALMVAACGIADVQQRTWPGIFALAPWAFGIVVLAAGFHCSRRAPRRTATAATAALAVVAMAAFGRSIDVVAAAQPPKQAVASSLPSRPNVILIVLDTTRRDKLGCYGGPAGLTPELDRFAAGATVYEDAYSVAPWTVPSHASLFTGLYPRTHGCEQQHVWLDDDFETLADLLGRQGYETVALCANFNLTTTNLLKGFQTRALLDMRYLGLSLRALASTLGMPERWVDKGGTRAVEEAASWLGRTHRPNSPFFMFVNLLETHATYLAPFSDRIRHLPPGVGYFEATRTAHRVVDDWLPMHVRRTVDAQASLIAHNLYEAELAYQDRCLGRLLNVLRSGIDLDNTLVIITADHGENLGKDGRWNHELDISDRLLRVPLIIRWPKRFPPGSRVSGLCELVDVLPTVFDVLGTPNPVRNATGRSLTPSGFVPRKEVLAQLQPNYRLSVRIEQALGLQIGSTPFNVVQQVLHTADFKYISLSDGRRQLFDTRHDPLEAVDLIDSRRDIAERMDRRLAELLSMQPVYAPKHNVKSAAPLDPETVKRIRALGYMQ